MIYSYTSGVDILTLHRDKLLEGKFKVLLFFLATQFDEHFLQDVIKLGSDLDALTGKHALAIAFLPPPNSIPSGFGGIRAFGKSFNERELKDLADAMTRNSYEIARMFGVKFDNLPALLFVNPNNFSEIAIVSLRNLSIRDIYSDLREIFSQWYTEHDVIRQSEGLRLLSKNPFEVYKTHKDLRSDFDEIARKYVIPKVQAGVQELIDSGKANPQELLRKFHGLTKQPRNIEVISQYIKNNGLIILFDGSKVDGIGLAEKYESLIAASAMQESITSGKTIPEFPLELVKKMKRQVIFQNTNQELSKLIGAKALIEILLGIVKKTVGL